MSHSTDRSVEAVIEPALGNPDGVPPWPIISPPASTPSFLRLWPGLSSDEIGTIMFIACLYNHIDFQSSTVETINAFLAGDGFVLPGGLRFSEGHEVKIIPGCCCGVEDWREWLEVPHGQNELWTGHDPAPEVEYIGNTVRIWQHAKADGVAYLDFERAVLEKHLKRVEADLKGFLIQLKKWTEDYAPGLGAQMVKYFSENMRI